MHPAVLTYPPLESGENAPATVYLSGGRGDAALGIPWEQRTFPATGPLVVSDQRGTGRSTPSLECPEVDETTWQAMAAGTPASQRSKESDAAFAACCARLSTTVDLDQYDTPAMAQDAEALRRALGLDPWNVFGLSYGTSLELELMRMHPDGVRSAVLDSVVPPDKDYGAPAEARRVDAAFDRLFAACDHSETCKAAHPDLRASLLDIRTTLNAEPHEVHFTDASGIERTARLTGDDVVSGVFGAMYDSTPIPLLPGVVDAVADGDLAVLDAVGAPLLASATLNANGVARSVVCADRQRLASSGDAQSLRTSHPLAALRVDGDGCDRWKVDAVPAADAHRLAEELGSTSTDVLFPALGHGVCQPPRPAQWASPTSSWSTPPGRSIRSVSGPSARRSGTGRRPQAQRPRRGATACSHPTRSAGFAPPSRRTSLPPPQRVWRDTFVEDVGVR